MFDKPEAVNTLGLELDGTILKGAQLSLIKGIPTLEHLFEIELKAARVPTDPVNPLDTTDEGQLLRNSAQKCLTVTSLDSDEVLIRSLDIKLKKERDIIAVLPFQAEPLLPYPVEDALLDNIVLSQNDEGTTLTLLAARKDHVQQHLERWEALQFDSEVVSCVPVDLAFFSKLVVESQNPHFVVHLGRLWTTCILVKEGKLIASQSSNIGLYTLLEALTKESATSAAPAEISSINFASLSAQDHPLLQEAVVSWQREIARLLSALSKQSKNFEVTEILAAGEGMSLTNLGKTLCQKANMKWLDPIIPPGFSSEAAQLPRYAVSIGAALSALPSTIGQINFRQKEHAYPQPWRRLRQPLFTYGALCLCLAVACYLFGQSYIGSQEDSLRQEFVNLLVTMNKSYPAFEKEFEQKSGLSKGGDEGIIKVENLTPNEISDRLFYLQKDLKDSPDTFPLQPNVPRVSDVLAWLSTHPNVAGAKSAHSEGISPLLQIDSFSYTMVKRPELKKKQEKYQVKVEVEFSTPTAKLAREFHDALIAPNDIVDPKGEVKWHANKGKYRASFFLKDKTSYP